MSLAEKIAEARNAIGAALAAPGPHCVTSSFQTDCVALLHLVIHRAPEIPVLFLDTGYHFAETYAYRAEIAKRFRLNLVNVLPKLTVEEQESQFGILHQTAPDRCCALRKVEPLFAALEPFHVWFTGLRRDQSPTRKDLQVSASFRLPSNKLLLKVSPLAEWTAREVWTYLKENGIPPLPLYDRGYSSIGCEPCTSLPPDPDNPRSGRWSGHKVECGIHIGAEESH
jgi:phosphoadenosine phosphosulfate reductase